MGMCIVVLGAEMKKRWSSLSYVQLYCFFERTAGMRRSTYLLMATRPEMTPACKDAHDG